MAEQKNEKNAPTGGVRAVERALDILLAFDAKDTSGLTAAELLERVGLNRATLYRLLYTLEQKEFISISGDPQRFRLGPAVGQLAWAWSASISVAQLAEPIMEEIWEATGESVGVFIPHQHYRICVAERGSTNPLSFKLGVGLREHLALGASGRAMLAWMDDDTIDWETLSKNARTSPEALRQELETVRAMGYATSHDEIMKGAAAIAVPFFGHDGTISGALAVYGPTVRMTPQHMKEIAPATINSVQKLSRALGKTPEP